MRAVSGSLARSMPEVHSVETDGDVVRVRSAGVSTRYLGPLQTPAWPADRLREFQFRFPRRPVAVQGGAPLPARVLGAFANGVPIYNHMEAASYQGRNLWHFDTIARARRDPSHPASPGLIEEVAAASGKHSPILGFAHDGYPVYGPQGFGADGALVRMRSSYRLRAVTRRSAWPDGTELTPGQWGPAVDAEYPLGTFAEDYEFAAGSGDLDACNGRFARTPEYPEGTYAYFLATTPAGELAYPYLIGRCLHGSTGAVAFSAASRNGLAFAREGSSLRFRFSSANGRTIRHLESVHERPFHLLIVSEDLRDFDHVHPELGDDETWRVDYEFPRAGRYFLYCDFTPPGSGQRVERIEVIASETAKAKPAPKAVDVQMEPGELRAGEDAELRFRLPPAPWRPYLGAWGHFVLIAEGHKEFVHAHPADGPAGSAEPAGYHVHGVSDGAAGPPPEVIRVPVNFGRAGRYKLWAQFQSGEDPVVVPFDLAVGEARTPRDTDAIPAGAIAVRITSSGFQPARVELAAGRAAALAFTRDSAPNCGGKVAIPELGITRELPPGGTAVVTIPAGRARDVRFQCGMGMYRGAIVVR